MTRLRAFGTHLALSVAVLAAMLAVFVAWWFPMPFFLAEGGWRALRIVAGVDMAVGPLLTLIVFNPKKSRRMLAFDMAVIGLLQIFAMSWGLFTVYQERTAAVVFSDGSFYTVEAKAAAPLAGIISEIRSTANPPYLVADLPDGIEERQSARKEAIKTQKPLHLTERYLKPLDQSTAPEVELSKRSPESVFGKDEAALKKFRAFCRKEGRPEEDFYVFPVAARDEVFAVILDKKTLKVADWMTGLDTGRN